MRDHRYILDRKGKKCTCENCGKKTMAGFVDTQTSEILPEIYGRCDREVNCGYFLDPYKSGYAKMVADKERGENVTNWKPFVRPMAPKAAPLPPSFIESETFKKSRSNYEQNNFALFLIKFFGPDVASKAIADYHIGTTKHQFTNKEHPEYRSEAGATIFWQIDTTGKVRSGKIMLYDPESGKRVKEPFSHITWAHKVLKIENYNLCQCLFGEHQFTRYPEKPVAVVESEKTAIIASVYLPRYNWVAVGALTNLKADTCQALKGKKVFLFPDLKCFDRWEKRAEELRVSLPGTTFVVSDLLEKSATDQEKEQGLDIADFMLKFEYKTFSERVSRFVTPPAPLPNTKFGEPDNQALNPEVSQAQVIDENPFEEIVPVQSAVSHFDIDEYRTWYQSAELSTIFILNEGRGNEKVLWDIHAFIKGRLLAIHAYTAAKEPDRSELLITQSKFIRQLQYIRKRAPV